MSDLVDDSWVYFIKELRTPVSIRKSCCRLPTGHSKSDPKRDAERCIAKIVNGVCQQGDTVGDEDNAQLEEGGDQQPTQGPLERPEPSLTRQDSWIKRACMWSWSVLSVCPSTELQYPFIGKRAI